MQSKQKMNKVVLSLAFIGLLAATALFLASCEFENCRGDGDCTVTFRVQDGAVGGLVVNQEFRQSHCATNRTWNSQTQSMTGGCRVTVMSRYQAERRSGTHSCNC